MSTGLRGGTIGVARRELPRTDALEPLPHPWLRNATITAAGGAVAAATAEITNYPGWTIPLAGAGIVVGGAVGAVGYRATLRSLEIDRACEQLATVMSLREPSRTVLRASRWSKGWPGRPGRLTVVYPTGALDAAEDFVRSVTDTVSGQGWGDYRQVKHDRRRCRLTYAASRSIEQSDSETSEEQRARRTVLTLLGKTAKIVRVEKNASGAVVAIEATHEVGEKLAASGYRARIERTVSALLPGRWRGKWNLESDWVRLEVRPEFEDIVYHRPPDIPANLDPKANYDQVAFAYGVDEDNVPVFWRPAIEPMMMVVGSTGSGKTSAMHTLLTEIVAYGWPVWVLDGKGIEFLGFQACPNVQIVSSQVEHQVALLHRGHQVMTERYAAIVSGDAHEQDFDPLVLFLDEFSSFTGNIVDWYAQTKKKGDPSKPPVLALVADIARKGRSCRVHIVMALQRPDQQYLGGDLRDNFRCRVSFGRLSPAGAMMMWESPTIGVAVPKKRGRGITINAADEPREIQGFYTPDPRKALSDMDTDVIEALWPQAVHHARLVIRDPVPVVDFDNSKPDEEYELGYRDYADAPWGLASEFPMFDAVARRERAVARGGTRKTMSPLEVLGLAGPSLPDSYVRPAGDGPSTAVVDPQGSASRVDELLGAAGKRPLRLVPQHLVDEPTTEAIEIDVEEGDWEGYGSESTVSPMELHVGDLILVDEDQDQWAMVDSIPDFDPFDDDEQTVAVTYSGDAEGMLSIPLDGEVTCRRPDDLVGAGDRS